MTFLITLLIALTAIVKLAQTIVEYKSAKTKLASEAETPITVTTISRNSQQTSSFRWRLFNSLMRYGWLAFIIYKMIFSFSSKAPATSSDIAEIGCALALMILYDNPCREGFRRAMSQFRRGSAFFVRCV